MVSQQSSSWQYTQFDVTLQILDCQTAWKASSTSTYTYVLNSGIATVNIATLVQFFCRGVMTTYTVPSGGWPANSGFSQTLADGTSSLGLQSTTWGQIGSYELAFVSTDSTDVTSQTQKINLDVVADCHTAWLTSISLPLQLHILGTPNTISIPAFTNVVCHPLVTSFTVNSTSVQLKMTQATTATSSNYGDSTLSITSLATDFALVGNFSVTVACSDVLQGVTNSFQFNFNIRPPCTIEWGYHQTVIPNQIYILGAQTNYTIPAFASNICNTLFTSINITSGIPSLKNALNLTQFDLFRGNSTLSLQTSNQNLRGNYTLKFDCLNQITLEIVSVQMILQIYDRCEFSNITTIPIQNQQLTQNGSAYQIAWQPFQQSMTGCGTFTYDVTFSTILGAINSTWFTKDLENLFITLNPVSNLTQQSIVSVTINGTILSQVWLPSSQINFQLIVLPKPKLQDNQTLTNTTNLNTVTQQQTQQYNFTLANQPAKNISLPNYPPLKCKIEFITSTGAVMISFSSQLVIPYAYQNLTQKKLKANYTDNIEQVLSIWVRSGQQKVDFNRTKIVKYNITDFQKFAIFLQIDFLNPDQISITQIEKDYLEILFVQNLLFVDQHVQYLANQTQVQMAIPQQMSKQEAQKIKVLASTVSSGMNVLASINLFINLVLSFSLKYLWNFVNLLQFLVFITKWSLNYPFNALAILQYLKSIALMEFIPTQQITQKVSEWIGLDPNDKSNLLNSMGMMLVIGVLLLVVIVALILAQYFVLNNYKYYKMYRQAQGSIFYNGILRYILQSNLKIGIAAGTTLTTLNWSQPPYGSVLSSSAILVGIFLCPLIFWIILQKNYGNLTRPSFRNKIGSIYLSIREKDKWALAYSPVFMARRVIFLGITFGLTTQPSIQIHLFTYLTVLYTIYLGLNAPHDLPFLTKSELFNEMILILICYHFILFTDIISDKSLRTGLGWSMAALIAFLFIVNFSIMIGANLQQFLRTMKLKKLKQKAAAERALQLSNKMKEYADQRIKEIKSKRTASTQNIQQQQIKPASQLFQSGKNSGGSKQPFQEIRELSYQRGLQARNKIQLSQGQPLGQIVQNSLQKANTPAKDIELPQFVNAKLKNQTSQSLQPNNSRQSKPVHHQQQQSFGNPRNYQPVNQLVNNNVQSAQQQLNSLLARPKYQTPNQQVNQQPKFYQNQQQQQFHNIKSLFRPNQLIPKSGNPQVDAMFEEMVRENRRKLGLPQHN